MILCVGVPFLVGLLAAALTAGAAGGFGQVRQPPGMPEGWVLLAVWVALYGLAGVSSWLVHKKGAAAPGGAVYPAALAVGFFWPVFFFVCQLYLVSLVWLLTLWVFVLSYSAAFFAVSKAAGLLQTPYIVWCAFVIYLNFEVLTLNYSIY